MFRGLLRLPFLIVVAILFGPWAGTPLVSTAQALHNCGEPHAKHEDDDDGRPHRCRNLDEDDFFYGDPRPDAPELAYRGPYKVGVRTLQVVHTDQIDILNYSEENTEPRYDRPLKLEVWYPAALKKRQKEITTYDDNLGTGPNVPDRPVVPFKFGGRAARGAAPDLSGAPYPLVIVSHGYPGSRVLLSNLSEPLASKGYIVVGIDHFESTHADKLGFSSTLLNRPDDILFVLNEVAEMGYFGRHAFLRGMVDAENTALIGYSMGGYGALVAAGAGLTEFFINFPFGVPGGYLARYRPGSPEYEARLDDRIKAAVLFAPCCATFGFWDTTTLQGLTIPSYFIVGDQDRTAPFDGVEFLYKNAKASDRYVLIYQGAIHEVPVNPAPPISESNYPEWLHYQEPAWDNRKLNNVNQHFVTAFLGVHLKGQEELRRYLDLEEPISNDSSRDDPSDPSYWTGFTPFGAIGMEQRFFEAGP